MASYTATLVNKNAFVIGPMIPTTLLVLGGSGSTPPPPSVSYGQIWPRGDGPQNYYGP